MSVRAEAARKGGPVATVRFRMSWWQWAPTLLSGLVCVSYAIDGLTDPKVPRVVYVLMAVLGGVALASAFLSRTFGVELTEQAAVVRGPRTGVVPWQDVQAVLDIDELGAHQVVLVRSDGRRLRLQAPTAILGWKAQQFARDYDVIGRWWVEHRGPQWRPVRPEAPGWDSHRPG